MIRIHKISLSFVVAIVIGALAAPAARAYVAIGAPWPADDGCTSNCGGKPFTIKYTIGNVADGTLKMPNDNPLPPTLIRDSINDALRVWAGAVNVNFVEVPDGPQTQLRFRRLFINGPDPAPPADPIAKAQATCLGYGSGCEVQYDESDPWQEVGTTSAPDILGATIHEVGHILGLYHTDVSGANMYWIFHRFNGVGTGQLFADDLAGIQSIYGAGVGSVSPIPEPTTAVLVAIGMCCLPIRRRKP